jgi:hypothetical protein
MIRNINNIDISSAILKSQRDGDTGNLSNSVHIGVSKLLESYGLPVPAAQ